MRASTIFALIIAILLGLGAAVGIKQTGILEKKQEAVKSKATPLILVAATNIFEGALIQASDVKIRGARSQDETNSLAANELLPPVTQAAVRRVAKVPIEADRPIRKDMLEDLASPGSIADRIGPCDRGVHCCLNKLYCAGGLIQPGDYVDVHLTTAIEGAGSGTTLGSQTAEAVIARGARVAARRNSLLPKDTPLGPDCCINYTLSANPYRAALIEYALSLGLISLHPVGTIEKSRLDTEWKRRREEAEALRVRGDTGIATVSTTDKSEPYLHPYCRTGDPEEDRRVAGILNGTYVISDQDLREIFGIKYSPPPPPRTIEVYSGTRHVGTTEFGPGGRIITGDVKGASYAAGAGEGLTVGRNILTGQANPSSGQVGGLRFRMPAALCAPGTTTAPVAVTSVRRRN